MTDGTRTSARPMMVEGVTFHCYRVGILLHQWWSEDGAILVQRNYEASTYRAVYMDAGGPVPVGSRFRSLAGAMAAAIKEQRKARLRRERAI